MVILKRGGVSWYRYELVDQIQVLPPAESRAFLRTISQAEKPQSRKQWPQEPPC